MAKWTTGLCECGSDCGICCLAFFCPCAVGAMNAEMLGLNSLVAGVAYFVGDAVVAAMYRGEIRDERGIEGDYDTDCCTLLWCKSCALRQEYTELRKGISPLEMQR